MNDQLFRNQLTRMLHWESAHANIDNALRNLPDEVIGVHVSGVDYSIWQLAEHIRLTQADILEFCISKEYSEKTWPDDFWPVHYSPVHVSDMKKCIEGIKRDRQRIIELVSDKDIDLFTPIPHGEGQNLFREVMLVIDHTAYHTGQIILIRKMLGVWSRS